MCLPPVLFRSLTVAARFSGIGAFLLGFALSAAHAPADQIVTSGGNITDAKIVGMQDGWLLFHTGQRQSNRVRPSEVGLIVLDRRGPFADFNQAERLLAEGLAAKAVVRYQRALRLSESFWPELVACRLVRACDRAGQIAEATRHWIKVVQGAGAGPPSAVRLMPTVIPDKRNAKFQRSVQLLDAAINDDGEPDHLAAYETLRYRILRHVSDKRTFSAAKRVAKLAFSESLRCVDVYELQLDAMRAVYETGFGETDLVDLDRAILDAPEASLPGFLLLKGELLLSIATARDEMIRAASTLMRVPIHMPHHPLAGKALYATAMALEKLKRPTQAVRLLEECLAHPLVGDDLRKSAESARRRLQKAGSNSEAAHAG